MKTTEPQHLSVPITKNAHLWATEFAAQQDNPQKGKQVYLNTLAVYAVHSYLKWLKIDTALNQSDSWRRGLREIFNVADLILPGVGKLECRPVLPGETEIILPAETTSDRIGYIGVQFSQHLDFVELLGFTPAMVMSETPQTLQIAQLQSFDALINIIHKQKLLVNLRQWVGGIFAADWQSPELVLASNFITRYTTTRSKAISRAKVIDIGRQILLLVQLTPTASEVFDIRLRVYPGEDSIHLPANLQLIIIDEAGNPCMEAQARNADDWIQLEFSCQHEEKFSVKMVLDGTCLTEEFVV
ncbi:MAG: DUF1822 family protein [Gloeotrichia echinulata GP01]